MEIIIPQCSKLQPIGIFATLSHFAFFLSRIGRIFSRHVIAGILRFFKEGRLSEKSRRKHVEFIRFYSSPSLSNIPKFEI